MDAVNRELSKPSIDQTADEWTCKDVTADMGTGGFKGDKIISPSPEADMRSFDDWTNAKDETND